MSRFLQIIGPSPSVNNELSEGPYISYIGPHLIGITGKKGSGKGTVAAFYKQCAATKGLLAVERGFADKVKLAGARIFFPEISLDEAVRWGDMIKIDPESSIRIFHSVSDRSGILKKITGREFLQRIGSEMGREIFGPEFWIDQLLPLPLGHKTFKEFETQNKTADICVISDVRFDNEAKRIIDLGGEIWEVQRHPVEGLYSKDDHASERGIDSGLVSLVINNNGSLDDLRLKVQEMFEERKYGQEER